MLIEEEEYFECVKLVPSKKANGFLTCSNCYKPLLQKWEWGVRNWNFCPVCGHPIKRGAESGKGKRD